MAEVKDLALGARVRYSTTLRRKTHYGYDSMSARKVWEPLDLSWLPKGMTLQPEVAGEGIVVGIRTLANGRVRHHYEEQSTFTHQESVTAIVIVHHLRRKPVLALPEHVEILEETHA